jgi:hypothetical protein
MKAMNTKKRVLTTRPAAEARLLNGQGQGGGGVFKKKVKNFQNNLDRCPKCRIVLFMTMIRKAIIKRMAELNLNANKLSEKLKGKIPRQTIYDFLTSHTDARTEVASELMKVLGLELTPKKPKRKAR